MITELAIRARKIMIIIHRIHYLKYNISVPTPIVSKKPNKTKK